MERSTPALGVPSLGASASRKDRPPEILLTFAASSQGLMLLPLLSLRTFEGLWEGPAVVCRCGAWIRPSWDPGGSWDSPSQAAVCQLGGPLGFMAQRHRSGGWSVARAAEGSSDVKVSRSMWQGHISPEPLGRFRGSLATAPGDLEQRPWAKFCLQIPSSCGPTDTKLQLRVATGCLLPREHRGGPCPWQHGGLWVCSPGWVGLGLRSPSATCRRQRQLESPGAIWDVV